MVWRNDYTPFGGLTGEYGTEAHDAKFTGKDLDEETGLYYFNARWYDAGLGRFISQDPVKDGVNWYAYANNNPMLFIDPRGLDAYIPQMGGNQSLPNKTTEEHTAAIAQQRAENPEIRKNELNGAAVTGNETKAKKGLDEHALDFIKSASKTAIDDALGLAKTVAEQTAVHSVAQYVGIFSPVAEAAIEVGYSIYKGKQAVDQAIAVEKKLEAELEIVNELGVDGYLNRVWEHIQKHGGSDLGIVTVKVTEALLMYKAMKADAVAAMSEARQTAFNFYKAQGWSEARINSHLSGIDFTKPVDIVTLPKGTQVVQYQIPGNPMGNYFAPVGTSADALGISSVGRQATIYTTTQDVSVLRSIAADTSGNLNVPALARGSGGGTQFFAGDLSAFSQ